MGVVRNVALAIGIGDAKGLSPLESALNGAQLFHDWAQALGYEATLLTTENGPVTMQDLRTAFDAVLNPGGVAVPIHRFLLYFAGHGLIREAGQGLWLLSDWYGEQRAVAVEVLRRRLSYYDIGQIALFADACRSLPQDIQTADLAADPVLGRGPLTTAAPVTVDVFVAAQDGSQAYTIPGANPEDDQCLFTGVLMRGLWGTDASAISPFQKMVTSASLGGYLTSQVPVIAAKYSLKLNPSVSFGFPELDCVYFGDRVPAPVVPVLPAWPPVPTLVGAVASPRPPMVGAEAPLAPVSGASAMDEAMLGLQRQVAQMQEARNLAQQMQMGARSTRSGSASRSASEAWIKAMSEPPAVVESAFAMALAAPPMAWAGMEAGVAVTGGTLAAIWADSSVQVRHAADGRWLAGAADGSALEKTVPMLVEVSASAYVAMTALPGFGAFMLLDAKGAAAVQYASAAAAQDGGEAVRTALIAMDEGSLRIRDADGLAKALGGGRVASPLLGVIAAYLYDSAGDTESIRGMAQMYLDAGEPIPYDLALLGMLRGEVRADGLYAVVPPTAARAGGTGIVGGRWPWLAQGWAYLDEPDDVGSPLIDPVLLQVRSHLTGARFTTVDAAGANLLAGAFGLQRRVG